MMICIAEMPSYTYAVKGKKLLSSKNIRCSIIRNEKTSSGSCGYMLNIDENCEKALSLLDKSGISYKKITDGGAL
ncbi:MAG: DUF3343 domain-containing protein [Ruminococcus sp.]|nr:DUF3343 domain-containing protein [Ruminococcus sp.]